MLSLYDIRRLTRISKVCLIAASTWLVTGQAAPLVPTSNFTEIPGALWRAQSPTSLRPIVVGGVTLTYNTTNTPNGFFTASGPIPDINNPDPGNGIGFYHDPTNPSPVVINFDTPISGFGATFLHMSDRLFPGFFAMISLPARIEVFSMPNAEGTLLGSIDSTGFFGPFTNRVPDFVGLYGYERVIRSAKIYGLAENEAFAILGYAVSVVQDTVPPNIIEAAASPAVLWPPNNRLRSVQLTVRADDASGTVSSRIISVTGNQPISAGDWRIVDDLSVLLRAKRSGTGSVRIYYIRLECSDGSGNKSWRTVTVRVLRARRFWPSGGLWR